jgi:hypothetical protein
MFDKISLKAMCKYEKETGKNSMELFQKENKSATDLRDLVFLIEYTKDNAITFDKIENMSTEEFKNAMESISKNIDKS